MPGIIMAVVYFLATSAGVLGTVLLNLGASLVLGQISKMFQKGPSSSSLAGQLSSRTVTSRQPIAPWRVLYGANRVGGIITFLHTTGTKNEKLHLVITIAGHEVSAISAMYFDGVAVPLDGSGNATGNFAGFAHAEFNLGTRTQAAFAGLLAAAPSYWDAAHRQRNRAGAYVQLTWDQNKFPNGVPNITFDVTGRPVYDPRGVIATDSFLRANENPLNATNWAVPTGGVALQIVSNVCKATTTAGVWNQEVNKGTFSADQYAEAFVNTVSGGASGVALLLRASTSALTYYHADVIGPLAGASAIRLWKRVAGTFTQLGSTVNVTVNPGDKLRFEVQGTTLTVKLNGAVQISQTDASISSGAPGLSVLAANAGDDVSWGQWEAGNLAAGAIVYSNNAALCIADYLNNASFGLVAQTKYPLAGGMLSSSGVTVNVLGNAVDGDVTTSAWQTDTAGPGAYVLVDLGAGNAQEFRRCRLYHNAAYAGSYHVQYSDDNITFTNSEEHSATTAWVPDAIGWNEVELAPSGAHRYWRLLLTNTPGAGSWIEEMEFYSSDVDSTLLAAAANTCDEQVAILAGGTQNRFAIDGSFDTSEAPAAVIGRMNSAMGGSVLYIAGKWGIYPGIWRAPTISLTDADVRGPMIVQPRLTHRDLYNGVKGTFISPTNSWQAADYPPFQSAAYLQEDNNEPLWLDVELPFTINGAMAQRLSKIALRRVRHQITVQGQFKLTAYQVQPLDVVQLSHPRFGWTNKTFEVTACTLSYAADTAGAPALGVDLTLREADATIYDWSTADEVALNAPPAPVLPQNAVTQPPTSLTASPAEIIRVVDGVRTCYIGLAWTAPADQFVTAGGHIIVQYKKHTDTNWTDIGKLKGNVIAAQIGPVIDGTLYDIQMWAENSSGVASSVVTGSATPTGTTVSFSTSTILNAQGNIPATSSAASFFTVYSSTMAGINIDVTTMYWSAQTVYRGDGSSFNIPASSTIWTAPGTPGLSQVAGGALGARTRYVRTAYVKDGYIVNISAEASLAVSASNLLKVTSPASQANSDGWVPIVGSAVSSEVLQPGHGSGAFAAITPIAFGTDWTEPSGGADVTQDTNHAPWSQWNQPGFSFWQLALSTTYKIYPYWDPTTSLIRLAGIPGTSASAINAASQSGDGKIALSNGAVSFTTPANSSSSSIGSGGGGGGGRGLM